MTIPSFRLLKSNAGDRVNASAGAAGVVLVYAGILTAMALFSAGVNFFLNNQIAQTGGLRNMGLRTILSTIQSILPMVQSVIAMCLGIGYTAAMLRVSRKQYTSPQTLRLGFSRFFLLLRTTLLQVGIFSLASLAAFWLSTQLFLMTPFSKTVREMVANVSLDPSMSMEALLSSDIYWQLVEAMIPLFVIFAVVYAVISIPLLYSYRMVNYLIIDKPAFSGIAILRTSRQMMKGHRMRLFRLDLSLWWWYLLSIVLNAVAYGDTLLPMAGVTLPFSAEVGYYLFYFLFLAGQFGVYVCLRNRVEVVYAQVYDALKPREKQEGVVLGNIFQM